MRLQLWLATSALCMSGWASAAHLECRVFTAENNGYASPCWGAELDGKKWLADVDVAIGGLTGNVRQVIWNGQTVCQGTTCTSKTFRQKPGIVTYTADVLYQNGLWETLSVQAHYDAGQ